MRRLIADNATEGTTAPLVTPAVAAGGVGGALSWPTGSNASFDAHMVIILAALLCALVCALVLNSVIRCALHCGRRLASSSALVITGGAPATRSVQAGTSGLKRKALRRIPVEVYGGDKSGALPATATECAICLGEFADGEKVRVLPRCHHGFHIGCIDMWLSTHSSCPTCRASLADAGAVAQGGR